MHYSKQYPILILLILVSLPVFGQSFDAILAKFKNYHQQTPLEKVYLHTDKEVYVQNETLWFSAYLVDGSSHIPETPSSLLYVDLFNPENKLVASLPIKIEEGVGAGEFLLADSLSEGTYTIMAYTNYMRNFDSDYLFSKPISFLHYRRDTLKTSPPELPQDIDFQLFPEGGHLIANMANIIAFRAVNEKGIGVDIKAEVVNAKDEVIVEFTSQHLGMGMFQFTPKEDEQYFVVYPINGKFYSVPVPVAKKSGYQLSVRQDARMTYIRVNATPGLSLNDCFVIVHIRSKVISVIKAKPKKSFIYSELNNNQLPSGILHFTVFKSGQPILERLAFVNNKSEQPTLTTTLKNQSLNQRETANFELSITSNDSSLVSGIVSVSVQKAAEEPNKLDIENFLLLTSDLKGTIENPAFYFDPGNPDKKKSIDLLMLTHGWRRFDWKDVLADSLPPIAHYPEEGFTIEGQVVNYYNRQKGHTTSLVLSFLEDMNFISEAETDADGSFWFDGLNVEDTVTAVIRTVVKNPKKSQRKRAKRKNTGDEIRDTGTFIVLSKRESPEPLKKNLETYGVKEAYREQLDMRLVIEQINAEFDEKIIVLDEVVEITAKRDRRTEPHYRNKTVMPYRNADSRVVIDSINGPGEYYNIFYMVSKAFPMVQVQINRLGLKILRLRENNLFVYLDGLEMASPEQVAAINPEAVEFIDLMRGNLNLVYNKGLPYPPSLYIYTRTTPKKTDPKGFQLVDMFGYHQPAEFYVPKYNVMSAKDKLKPDYRATQYWNPKVKFSDMKASFSYYTSDNLGDFIMYIEGITNNGKTIRQEFKFAVN